MESEQKLEKRKAESLELPTGDNLEEKKICTTSVKKDLGKVSIPSLGIAVDSRMNDWKICDFSSPKITLYSWNVNGLKAILRKGQLQKFIKERDPDIICLNETKLSSKTIMSIKSSLLDDLFPDKYLHFWNNSSSKAGYAGTAVLTKVKPLDVSFETGVLKHDMEGRTTTVEFEKFVLIACYVPNSGQKLDRLKYRIGEWDPDFRNYVKKVETERKKPVVLCGDLNITHREMDISHPKENLRKAGFTVEERAEFNKLLDLGFVDTFRRLHPTQIKYSYWSIRTNSRAINRGLRADYFVISENFIEKVVESDVLTEVFGSDHCPIKLCLDFSLQFMECMKLRK